MAERAAPEPTISAKSSPSSLRKAGEAQDSRRSTRPIDSSGSVAWRARIPVPWALNFGVRRHFSV